MSLSICDGPVVVIFTLAQIADLFDTVTISSLAHAAKPSARIFQQALEKHAVDPAEALHVGDSERDDVKGAQAVGLTGVLLTRGMPENPLNGISIANLNDLLPLLSRLQ